MCETIGAKRPGQPACVAGIVVLLSLAPAVFAQEAEPALAIQRVTTVVPWPRGIVLHEGKLYVLARGVHRSAGGPSPDIPDMAGHIFEVDPNIHEPVVKGQPPGDAVKSNGKVFAAPNSPPFRIWKREMPATNDTLTDQPYCKLMLDVPSRNLFVVCFAGIDLASDKPTFRKNATDAVHRYSLTTRKWYVVEAHDEKKVSPEQLGQFLPNDTFPHHDIARNQPPHGFPNGACGGTIVGNYMYVAAKDNSALIQYDLAEIRKSPDAGPPNGRYIFRRSGPKDDVFLEMKGHGNMYVEGTCGAIAHGGYLYVTFRTTSQLIRIPIDRNGDVIRPIVGEYLAQFDPYDNVMYGGSADIFDVAVNSKGEIFVSCNAQGTVWRVRPDPSRVMDCTKGTKEKPYVNLRKLTDHEKSTAGNMIFDAQDNLFITTGNKDVKEGKVRGTVYRIPAH
jgi:hypothetical protein